MAVCRDADETVALGFPIFSRHIIARAARTRIKILEMNAVVQFGSVRVRPGDSIVADRTGAVVIPKDKAADILQQAIETEKTEKYFAEELRKGRTFRDIHRETGQF